MKVITGLIVAASAFSLDAWASGHGPVFVLATPTLGRGDFSLDFAVMGRSGDSPMAMLRPMLGYGITEDLQFSVSVPMPLYRQQGANPARMASWPAEPDVELLVGISLPPPKAAEVRVTGRIADRDGKLVLSVNGPDLVYVLAEDPDAAGRRRLDDAKAMAMEGQGQRSGPLARDRGGPRG